MPPNFWYRMARMMPVMAAGAAGQMIANAAPTVGELIVIYYAPVVIAGLLVLLGFLIWKRIQKRN